MLLLALLLIQAIVTYRQLKQTSPVTTDNALAEYRRRLGPVGSSPSPSAAPGSAVSSPTVAPTAPIRSGTGPTPSPVGCDWVCAPEPSPPAYGVYAYWQCGLTQGQCRNGDPPAYEKIGGLRRDFPDTGQRIVSPGPGSRFSNLHIYSQDADGKPLHQEEFELAVDDTGVMGHRYKVDITLGGHTETTDIRQVPYLRFVSLPFSVGKTWSGSWKDSNGYSDATYTCTVLDKQELTIGGTKVRTWVVQAKMKLEGPKNRGDVTVTFWVAPEYRQTVQELYEERITNAQNIPYEGRWMVTLKDLEPSR